MTDTFSGKIVVLGGGAWGTALAAVLAEAGRDVHLWAREANVADALNTGRGNPVFLPGTQLPTIPSSTDLAILSGAKIVLAVVPAQYARASFETAKHYLAPGTPIVLCSKGIEQSSLKFLNEVLDDTLPEMVPAVLSGPSFARDVARGLPTAVTLATADLNIGQALMSAIGQPSFRPYWSDDIIGAEVGGAVKNVLAIACGIVEGLDLGRSAHAALISRGFAEMTRLGVALGGRPETLAGLSGLGDLVLTCSSPQSRNMSFGMALGRGRFPEEILAERNAVTEGVATAPALMQLARNKHVDMPICEAVASILAGDATVTDTIDALLARPFKEE